ncbi:RidA family protein [Kitasatospora sp. NPDC056783]|uniref:RidA family protein n=1 Tax=Kitasatospora sp. NPDC056783 TaxID=3345943 RepID=UPI0036988A74
MMNPEGLPEIDVYRQVSVATGSKLVFVAGQVAWDAEGRTVGEGDLAAQTERCYLNVATALDAAGASRSDRGSLPPRGCLGPVEVPGRGAERRRRSIGVRTVPPVG